MNKCEVQISEEWPYNLIAATEIEPDDPLSMIDDTGTLEITMAISSLTPREKKVLRMRYAGEMKLKAVGEALGGITTERTRQIEVKALRKLRHPYSRFILEHGIKAYIEKRINDGIEERLAAKETELERAYQIKMAQLDKDATEAIISERAKHMSTTIEEMDLSVRAYNCLKRAYCDTVYDILTKYPDYEQAMQIRNLGRKSLEEIRDKLKKWKIEWPANYER